MEVSMFRATSLGLALAAGVLAAGSAAADTYISQAAFDAAASTTLLEDFEGLAPGLYNTPLPSFSRNGATYVGLAGTPFLNIYLAGDPVNFPNFGADIPFVGPTQLTSHVMTANGDENIRATFTQGYRALGMDLYFNGLGPATISFLDQGGGVIESITSPTGHRFGTSLADIGFGGIVSDTPVWGFQWTSTLGGQTNTGFDNIRVAAIPEPGTWALMLLGFGGLGAGLRMRRRFAAAL
jgi:hypothetical protein